MSTTTTYTVASRSQTLLSAGTRIRTIDELVRQRALELNDSPLIGYPRRGIIDFEEHSARAIDRYADAAVVSLQQLGLEAVVCHHFFLNGPIPFP